MVLAVERDKQSFRLASLVNKGIMQTARGLGGKGGRERRDNMSVISLV